MSYFVRGVYQFASDEPGEIPILPGDVIQVLRQIDDNWLEGNNRGNVGNFPKNFVQPVDVQFPEAGEKLFLATKTFITGVDGDLCFNKGDVILGTNRVDDNWWMGDFAGSNGIFPVTHVEELAIIPPANNEPPAKAPVIPEPVQNNNNVGELAVGRATLDLTAQLDDELSFITGDLIHVTEVLDDDFAIGKCGGKSGMFPLSFVEIIEGSLEEFRKKSPDAHKKKHFDWFKDQNGDPVSDISTVGAVEVKDKSDVPIYQDISEVPNGAETPYVDEEPELVGQRSSGSYTHENTKSFDTSVTPYGKTLFPFSAERDNELSFVANQIVSLICHIDDQWIEGEIDGKLGIFPASYVEIIVDCPFAPPQSSNHEPEASQSSPFVELYGRVLFDFQAISDHDLDLKEGDTVTIINKVDEYWFEAHHDDGRTGLVPVSYVEVIEESALPEPPKEVVQVPDVDLAKSPAISDSVSQAMNDSSESLPSSADITPQASPPKKVPPAKPAMKPKPQLKPKPQIVASTSQECSSINPAASPITPPPSTSPQTVIGNDVEHRDTIPPKPKPARPSKSPQIFKSVAPDASLDDLIRNELNLAKSEENATETQPKPTNEPTKVPPKKPKGPSLNELAKRPMSATTTQENTPPSAEPHCIGQSQFFFSSMFDVRSESKSVHFPVSFSDEDVPSTVTQRKPSTKKRAPPPRPSGPRPPPAPSKKPLIPDSEDNLSASLVPQRAAPPRPQLGDKIKTPVAPKRRKQRPLSEATNLLEFSPEAEEPQTEVSEENQQVIQDLERRLSEIDKDLQSLQQEEQQMAADTAADAENLSFYRANIDGLTKERQQLKESLYKLDPNLEQRDQLREQHRLEAEQAAERRQQEAEEEAARREEERVRRRGTRERVIEELIQTEKSFLSSLSLCVETFLSPNAPKCSAVDLDVILGNIDEVMEVSQRLLNSLEGATSGREFEQQLIGSCFVQLKDEMEKVYALYCKNHNEVIALLEKLECDEEVQEYFTNLVNDMRLHSQVFDIHAILIKPVQRILKYPLLLNELIKATEEEHEDKTGLLQAVNAMTDVAAAINELKRRKDLVMRYRTDKETTLAERMSRFNYHSTKKKLSRLSQKVVGVQTVDQGFVMEERRFKALDIGVRTLVRDISLYLDNLQETVASQESVAHDISDYYGDQYQQPEVQQFCKVHNQVAASMFQAFRSGVEDKVMMPLNRLLLMFQGPSKVIKKRYDKLLDYDKVRSMRDNDTSLGVSELKVAQQNYEALNKQLLDELPQLYELSRTVVTDCLRHLVASQRNFFQQALNQTYQLLSLPLVVGSSQSGILDTFNITHTTVVDRLSDISFVTKAFNPQVEERRRSKASSERRLTDHRAGTPPMSVQSDSQQVYLRQIYSPDKLYTVTQEVGGDLMMDLQAPIGCLVGVIKEGDPMGNKERWFVDNGADKGFMMRQCLSPLRASVTSPTSSTDGGNLMAFSPDKNNSFEGAKSDTLASFQTPPSADAKSSQSPSSAQQSHDTSQAEALPEKVPLTSDQPSPIRKAESNSSLDDVPLPTADEMGKIYQAVYPFQANTELELTLSEGDMVRVIEEHDLEGNTEWWLVEARGSRGYAPASYLYKVK